MTNQVAITMLKNLEQSLDDYCELNDEGKEAFHMAITALELFGNSEQLPSTHSKLEKNSTKLDKEIGECNDCIKHGGDWECDRVHCHKGDVPDTNVGDLISRQKAIEEIYQLLKELPNKKNSALFKDGVRDGYARAIGRIRIMPSAQPEDWMERNKDRILQAGMEGREIEFRIGGRLFAIREKAQ